MFTLKTSPALIVLVLALMVSAVASDVDAKSSKTSKKPAAQKSSPAFIKAQKDFNAGKFHEALKQFETLDRNGMCNDMTHYYMALCYQRKNQMAAAVQNYEYVVANSQNASLRSYADAAMRQLSYYQKHRTYQGQGNRFVGQQAGGGSRGGGVIRSRGGGG